MTHDTRKARTKSMLACYACILLTSYFTVAASAAVWCVDKDNTGAEDGTAWGTAYTTIQPAIDAAYNDGGGGAIT